MDNILIVSLRPLEPVRSGFQNTVYLLNEALKKKFNSYFLLIENKNDVDPVFGLDYSKYYDNELDEAIRKHSPKFIFVNTSKLLHLYNKVLFKIGKRRSGDVEIAFADTEKAKKIIGWESKYSLTDALKSAWKWEQNKKSVNLK